MWVFDIEVFKNLFLVVFKRKNETRIFEISKRKSDTKALALFIAENSSEYFIGYNSERYDIPMLERFLKLYSSKKYNDRQLVEALYQYSQSIFKSKKWFTNSLKTIDLFLLHHFDNKSKMTSLKELEFTMRMENISSLHLDFDMPVEESQIDSVIEYCINDVEATEKLKEISQEEIDMRVQIGKKYNLNCLSWNAPKIGEEVFKSILQSKGINTNRKTPREQIRIKQILFDIKFNSEPFKAIYKWYENKVITSTLKVFTELPFEELETLEGFYNVHKIKGVQENLNIVFNGLEYVFGVGGIHACISSGIYIEDEEYFLLDIDVSSYYTNIAKKKKLYPAHLNRIFCEIFDELYLERMKYPKKSVVNEALKLALNGVYGKSNSEYSIFYDPAYTMSITINGQLLICRLAEMITEFVGSAMILQANTDGVTVKLKREDRDTILGVCKAWENYTELTLEYAEYTKMVIRDVNNYFAIDKNGYTKRKGCFKYVFKKELLLNENHSFIVVQKSLEEYFNKGILPENFIPNHKDIYDFFGRIKLKSGSTLKLIFEDKEIECQKVTRYYVSNNGGTFKKTTESGRSQIVEKGFLCTECNDLRNKVIDRETINYEYYIQEAYKIINAIENV